MRVWGRSGRLGRAAALAALAPFLLLSPAAAQNAETSRAAPGAADESYSVPPLRFAAVGALVDALGLDATHQTDPFWRGAIAALVAANPGRADAARTFAEAERAAEFAGYRPLVASRVDDSVVELLEPEVERQLVALEGKRSAESVRTPALSEERQGAYAAEWIRIMSAPAARVDARLRALAGLALTPDGLALRELNRKGLFHCLQMPRLVAMSSDAAYCATLEKAPPLRRLRKTADGDALIRLSTLANVSLVALIQMGRDEGVSLYRLLAPETIRAAGFEVPPNLSWDELRNSYATKAPTR